MSDKRPLLSIIIPVFNNELYIKQTLTSVFEQIDNDVEVIIVNVDNNNFYIVIDLLENGCEGLFYI